MGPNTNLTAASLTPYRAHLNTMDVAGKKLERFFARDGLLPNLTNLLQLSLQSLETCSGLNDVHYQSMSHIAPDLPNVKQIMTTNKIPLPPEIMEHFNQMQYHCMMGLFPEIKRAWLTIDSDIYIWSYEHGTDLAYYDGLNEVIISVGLVKPKPNVFNHNYVKHLLVVTTTAQIVVLGVRFTSPSSEGPLGALETIHLLPEPILDIPTEGVSIATINCSDNGRLFLGGRDGSLFEIDYRVERSWFGKRFNKKNHSTGYLSYLMPSFISSLAYGEDDPVRQISIDNSRHILFTLSERGNVEVWDLGSDGNSMSRVATASQANIVQSATNIVKTLDVKCFRPIVHIAALEIADSPALNLVAVARTGARLYFATSFPTQQTFRPSTLALRHVRMPPGYAANSPVCPPPVTMPLYSRGNLLLVTSPGGEKDELWCLCPDLFPTAPCLTEAQTIMPLDGRVWAICEEPQMAPLSTVPTLPGAEMPHELPPLVVRQHLEPARKYVLLTAQGVQIVTKVRPVDILRQILAQSHGPDAAAVRNFFNVLMEDQACASALVLACLESGQNAQMAEWATRAFFIYGGEAKVAGRGNILSPPTIGTPYQQIFQPGVSSTPRAVNSPPQLPIGQPIEFLINSAKHDALYLHVCRIVRPIWSAPVVVKVCPDGQKVFMNSSLTSEDCVWILGHLHSLKTFLEKNSQITASPNSHTAIGIKTNVTQTPGPGVAWTGQQVPSDQDAQIEEKNSLKALKMFVAHTCEVMGLWKLLCEHQCHLIFDMLDKEVQVHLPMLEFKTLLVAGHETNSMLINCLINSYLSDCASVDSISEKLRDVCPTLFRNEDAVYSKANEMLLAAAKTQLLDEKEDRLRAALNLCKEVAPHVDLATVCRQFAANQFYIGVLHLCLTYAAKQDPQDVAVYWYKNNEPPEDAQGYSAYIKRMEIYQQVTLVLDQLYQQSLSAPGIPAPVVSPGAFVPTTALTAADAEAQVKRILRISIDSKDELLHVAVLDWMLRRELYGELIAIDSPSVETFLTRAAARSTEAADLLWKFYEQHGNHASAAKMLHQLANTKTRPLSLADRDAFLARAIMCMRSDRVGSAPHLGVFLQELEDQMAVAVIQRKVLDAVKSLPGRGQEIENAIQRLNSELLTCTDLYEQFAEPLHLWECKLAIIHSTNHNDPQLIEEIWQNIVASEIRRFVSWNEKMSALSAKISELAAEFGNSARCFPLAYIVRAMEMVRCKGRCTEPAFRCLLAADVPYSNILQVYEALATSNDRTWALDGNEFHIIQSIAELTDYFADHPSLVPPINRKAIVTKSLDLLSRCVVVLYAKTGTQELIAKLKAVESKLKRIGGF